MARYTVRLSRGSGDTFGVDDISCAVATELGFFRDQGLDVSWLDCRGGVASMQAALDGAVDVVYAGFGPVISLRAAGNPCRIVVSQARALAQALVAQNRLTNPGQLGGVSWAVDGIGAMSHHMGRLIVRALGIDERTIRWEPVGPPPLRIQALLDDRIDVSLIRTEEALSLNRHHRDRVHRMLDFDDLKRLVPVQPHGVICCTEAYEARHEEELFRVTKAFILASRELHTNPDAFRDVLRRNTSVPLDDDEIRLIWQREHDHGGWAINGELTRGHWAAEMALYHELNPTMRRVSREELIAERFVPAALAELGVFAADFDQPET